MSELAIQPIPITIVTESTKNHSTSADSMTQVDYLIPTASQLPPTTEEGLTIANSVHHHSRYLPSPSPSFGLGSGAKYSAPPSHEDFIGALSLPTPPPDEFEFDSYNPSTTPSVNIPGLPILSYGAPQDLIRSRILQAAFDAEMGEPDAEKAFFVADLSVVYDQFVRFRRCLPEVEPFYGTLFLFWGSTRSKKIWFAHPAF